MVSSAGIVPGALIDRSRLEVLPKVWLDHRRAVFLEEHSLLAVADLHLGYTWAHRYNGQMLPLGPGDQLQERLGELCRFYKPKTFAVLGDIVHQAVPVAEVAEELRALINRLQQHCETKLILGNHDKKLARLLWDETSEFTDSVSAGQFLLMHGNEPIAETERMVIIGHEHPAISLGDGILGARFPCFLISQKVLVLPAFSRWAAGSNIRSYPFMSPIAKRARFHTAVAICGDKLLPVPL